jgi:hypothetical protein
MRTPKIQAVETKPQGRTVTLNDDHYLVHFEVPCEVEKNEVRITGIDKSSLKATGGYVTTKELVNLVNKLKSHFIYDQIDGVNFFLPCDLGSVELNEKDIAVLDLVLNEPDDELLSDLLKKLEAI